MVVQGQPLACPALTLFRDETIASAVPRHSLLDQSEQNDSRKPRRFDAMPSAPEGDSGASNLPTAGPKNDQRRFTNYPYALIIGRRQRQIKTK